MGRANRRERKKQQGMSPVLPINMKLQPYLFVLPATAIFFLFYLIPFVWVFYLSLFAWDGIQSQKAFVGLANFKEIILHDPQWWQAVKNVAYIAFIALTLQNTLAFILAWLCNYKRRGVAFYRTVFFIPPILSEIVVGLVWRFLLSGTEGIDLLNRVLNAIGLDTWTRSWLANPHTVLNVVALVHSWKGFGWGFLIFLAGLQAIPQELYDAARVDGADGWECFKRITLPLMMPVVVLVSILTILGAVQGFILVIALVGGEFGGYTSVPVLRILVSMLANSRFGYACAQGIVLGVILSGLSFLFYRLSRRYRAIWKI